MPIVLVLSTWRTPASPRSKKHMGSGVMSFHPSTDDVFKQPARDSGLRAVDGNQVKCGVSKLG